MELTKHFSGGAVKYPIVIRGASADWKISKIAERGWEPLKEALTKQFGKEPIGYKTSARVAQFGGSNSTYDQTFSLTEYLTRIEDGRGVYIAFQASSDLGKKISKAGFYSLDHVAENGYFKPFGDHHVISFGGDGDGLPFHTHGETVLGLVAGMKQWLMMAPGDMTEDVLGGSFNVTRYMDRLLTADDGAQSWPKGMIYCEQRAGDVLYVPFNWWHATKNVGITIGLGGQQDAVDPESFNENLFSFTALPDLELRARIKLQDEDPAVQAEGLAELLDAFNKLPSKLSLSYRIVSFLTSAKQQLAASAHLRLVLWHLRSLEKRGGIDDENLAALFAHLGDLAINFLRDANVALDILGESLRLDPNSPAALHNSAYAILQLPEASLPKHKLKKKTRVQEVIKRLKKALELNPAYEPSRKALKQLGVKE